MKKMDLREIQLAELEIMRQLKSLFEKHHLRYVFTGGTLLGAIRHDGFIPWDDDIDIGMPRKDYDNLMELVRKGSILIENISIAIPGQVGHAFPFIKVYDDRTHIEDAVLSGEFDSKVFVDVFPIDHFSDSFFMHRLYLKWNRVLRGALITKTTRTGLKRSVPVRAAAYALYTLLGGYRRITERIDDAGRNLNRRNSSSGHMGNSVWPEGKKEYFPKEVFFPCGTHVFEGISFSVPHDYHTFLRLFYGDYMVIPPEEKRGRHDIAAYRLEDK